MVKYIPTFSIPTWAFWGMASQTTMRLKEKKPEMNQKFGFVVGIEVKPRTFLRCARR